MNKDYSNQVKELIKKHGKEDIIYLKPLSYLTKRNGATKEELDEEIIGCADLKYVEKQDKLSGTRYALFFVYSNKKGRCQVLEFDEKIKVVTVYPIGKRTISRYKKKRFKTLEEK